MPATSPFKERRKPRFGLRVIHQHRVRGRNSRRESDLIFVNGQPFALPEWINLGGVRTPLYSCELDSSKLRAADGMKRTYYYDAVTVDPRFEPVIPGKAPN